ELVATDATSLLTLLTTEEVSRFITPPPTTLAAFVKFIEWTQRERRAGRQVTFGLVPPGVDRAVGLIQFRELGPKFSLAEWGFALGSPFWGDGRFMNAATMVLDFAFHHLKVH